jgi:hypothetical protein
VKFSRRTALLLAPLLLLAIGVTSAISAPGQKPRLRTAPARVPDWRLVDPSGDDDEISPPLTFEQLTEALRHATEGPELYRLRVTSGRRFAHDRPLLATISPNGDGLRDRAVVQFRLEGSATVALHVLVCRKHPTTVWSTKAHFGPGPHHFVWEPPPSALPQTYELSLTVIPPTGPAHVYGSLDHRLAWLQPAPVVRVMGIDAGFSKRSYAPGALARLRVATDVPSFTIQFFQAGPEDVPTSGNSMEGVPVSEPREIDWSGHRNAPANLNLRLGDWPNGFYFAELTSPDGQDYYAPLVIRPHVYGLHGVAVVLRTNTWHAYSHQDADGDGWGDTWYAANDIHSVNLSLPYVRGGAPPKWRVIDLPFYHWLYRSGKEVDFLSDDDLAGFRSARSLARLYDLIVFPGHEEYVSAHVYDLIAGFRNLGGNLMFLSSTNLLWRVNRHGDRITRIAEWRQLGRPESRIVGVQYRANDEGEHRGPYVMTAFGCQSWEFAGVGEDAFEQWRWLGIEFDMRTSVSPASTRLLARVNPHLRNRTIRGDMTYYQRGSAKVFAAGTLDFSSALVYEPYRRLLDNLWAHLAKP